MADVSHESLVDEREEVMIPPNGDPILRSAHFLKPIFTFNSIQQHPPPPLSVFSPNPIFNQLKKLRLMPYPPKRWKIWVHILKPKYQEIWKKAGIYEAILASTYKIPRDKNLIISLAQRWCDQTNTIIFPWGEVTITLEDIIYLGNYSVLGAPFSTPLHEEFTDIFNCMRKAHQSVRKRSCNATVSSSKWMNYFLCSGKQLEHEAFLAMWLSMFVLVQSPDYIAIQSFPVAIHLSRGTKIALAPVVLAIIYRDMRLLHSTLAESGEVESNGSIRGISHVDLVQMWAWERFSYLRPNPNVMENKQPRSARWNGLKSLKVKDVSAALGSAGKSFLWRPYAMTSSNCILAEIYRDNEQWMVAESDESEAFARCLRVSELFGLGYTEQYHPNRVAMQFGLDQDIPPPSDEGLETAWCSSDRPIRDAKLYVPPRLFESSVSSRYLDWWRGLVPAINEDATRQRLIPSCPKRDSVDTPGCASKCLKKRPRDNDEEDSLTIAQLLSRSRMSSCEKSKNDADNEPILALCSETQTKYLCMNEPAELIVSSSKKYEKSKSSGEKQIEQAEIAVVSKGTYQEVNGVNAEEENRDNGTSEVPQLEIETHKHKTTSEAPKLDLKTRILRLEMIVDMIKTTKIASSSRDIN